MAMALLSVVSLSIVAGVTHNAHVRYAFLAFGEPPTTPLRPGFVLTRPKAPLESGRVVP
jgi:hypothetical protein